MENQSIDVVLPGIASTSPGRPETQFIFPPAKLARANLNLRRAWPLALLATIALLFLWAAWDSLGGWLPHSATMRLITFWLPGMVLAVIGAAAGAGLRHQQLASRNAELAEANARLRQEHDLLRAIIDHLPDFIYAKDRRGHFLLNNLAHAGDLGATSPEAMKDKSDFDFFPRELAEQFFNDEQKIISTGQSVINQEQYKSAPGRPADEKRWSLTSKVVWRGQSGEILGTVGITRDIHEFKQTQEALRQSEEKLRQFAARLEQSNRELQDFAYVASHDLQEPLRKIVVFGGRLKDKYGETLAAEPRDYVERMQKAATRMQSLINDLLTFSRLTTRATPPAPVNLSQVAHEVLEDLESRVEQAKGHVEIGELPVIDAESLQMRQLFQNLIGNALKFQLPGVPPVVKVTARKFTGEDSRELCEIRVSDNGIGFDEKYLDRIFNVFQRLHSRSEYEGTGMGLAIVRKIAQHHGGSVTAQSQPGHGAAIIVTLPATHAQENADPPKNKL